MLNTTRAKALGMALLVLVLGVTAASAQDAQPAGQDVTGLWNDFIHYIRIGRADAALANGQALLDAQPDPRAVYQLSAKTGDIIRTLDRGQTLGETQPGLADVVKALREMIEEGYRLESRDPEQIRQAIDMLDGTTRQYQLGLDRLKRSGEFAVPQLVARLGNAQTSEILRDRIVTVLPELGKEAVRPLSEALQSSNPVVRNITCRVLGRIGYWHAAPHLRAVLAKEDEVAEVKASAAAALQAVTGDPAAAAKPLAGYYYELGERYYGNAESLQPDTRYDVANVWYWQDDLGLTYKEAPTPIFMDVYTMRSARQTLDVDGSFEPAVSLWLAAYLRKEAHLPAGATDPTRGAEQLAAAAYAKAAGAKYAQQVLARALRDRDVAVAVGVIPPLADIAGAKNLIRPVEGGANPLVEALTYPNRLVRFLAMQTLINANPQEPFNGSELVMQVAIEALRQTGKRTALLVEPDEQTRNTLKDSIRSVGYEVVDGANYAEAVEAARRGSGVDVLLLSSAMRGPALREAMAMVRSDPAYASLPVVVLAAEADVRGANQLARQDEMTIVVETAGMGADAVKDALQAAAAKMAGEQSLGEDAAAQWALRTAAGLEMLGETRNPVYKLALTEPALVDNLAAPRDELKIACAQALAVQSSGTAQRAIAALALSDAADPVRVAAFQAAAKCVRLIGNQLTEQQADAVVEFVQSTASQDLRDAASELLGSLDLPSEKIKGMILSTAGMD